ncbi:unnamed protein product [Jaminaea pallidilutea]
MLRSLSVPRLRRNLTSSIFLATFVGSILTVSATHLFPCPARPNNGGRGIRQRDSPAAATAADSHSSDLPASSSSAYGGGDQGRRDTIVGERVRLSGRKGWISVEDT